MDPTEKQVQQYFMSRPGWTAQKLRPGKTQGQVPDFRICHGEKCFLCEVKTIRSVRADIPEGQVVDHFTEQRDKKRAMVDQWSRGNPDRTRVMSGVEWDWLNASDAEFRRRYVGKQRGTEGNLSDHFEKPLRQRLESCAVAHLPYDLRLDSDDLYVPSKAERRRFLTWLEEQIGAIERGDPVDRRWGRQDRPYPMPVYSARYPLHEPADEYDSEHNVSVCLRRRGWTDDGEGLRVDIHCYGTLNVERVRSNVEKAIGQLGAFATREQGAKRLPRVIVLRFEAGLYRDHWELLKDEIRGLFGRYDDLSAIAVLQWRLDARAPPTAFFRVYHNGRLTDATDPLDPEAFGDRWSIHTQVGME